MIIRKTPMDGAVVSLQTPRQKEFCESEESRKAADGSLSFRWYALEEGGAEHSLPLPVHFSWEEEGAEAPLYQLLVSRQPDMSAPRWVITGETEYDWYNLEIGATYYWCVQKDGKRSSVGSFSVAQILPRNLKIDGISNVRDMGGYRVKDGVIRQGRIFRGGELELHMHLTQEGAMAMKELGIRTDLDMRGEAVGVVEHFTSEALGMQHILVPSVPYDAVFAEEHRQSVRELYQVFTKPENFPIYFHCWGGADRGGTAAFLLGAFFGMSYEDLIFEYEYTSLAIWGIRTRNYPPFAELVRLLTALPGKDLQEKARYFLKHYADLTDSQLDGLYDAMVEKG